jgi:hypothetical protein
MSGGRERVGVPLRVCPVDVVSWRCRGGGDGGLAFARSGMKRSPRHNTSREVIVCATRCCLALLEWKELLCKLSIGSCGLLVAMRGTTSAGPRRETAEVSTDPPIEIWSFSPFHPL